MKVIKGCNENKNLQWKRSTNTQLKSENQVPNSKLDNQVKKKKKSSTCSRNTYKTTQNIENTSKCYMASTSNDIRTPIPNIVTSSNQKWKNWKNSRTNSAPVKGKSAAFLPQNNRRTSTSSYRDHKDQNCKISESDDFACEESSKDDCSDDCCEKQKKKSSVQKNKIATRWLNSPVLTMVGLSNNYHDDV